MSMYGARPRNMQEAVLPQIRGLFRHTPGLRRLDGTVAKFLTSQRTDVAVGAPQHGDKPDIINRYWFTYRMPRSVFKAVPGVLWNTVTGTFIPPMIVVMGTIQGTLRGGPKGLVVEGGTCMALAVIWMACGYTAAAAQVLGGLANTAFGPYRRYVQHRYWHPVHHEWREHSMAPDVDLQMLPTDEAMRDNALGRMAAKSQGAVGEEREFYKLLGIHHDATPKEVKAAYRKASLHLHPDRNKSPTAQEDFDKATKAYRVLSDPDKRKTYDAGGEAALSGQAASRRDMVVGLMGGERLRSIAGDVLLNRPMRYMIDAVRYDPEEVEVLLVRMHRRCAEALLEMLEEHPGATGGDKAAWQAKVRKGFTGQMNTGLAKEVIWVLAEEYTWAVESLERSPVQRMLDAATRDIPNAVAMRCKPYVHLLMKGTRAKADPTVVMETMWHFGVRDLRTTARHAALSLVLDDSVAPEERTRRAVALREFADMLLKTGTPFDRISDSTLNAYSKSTAEYMRRQQQARENK